GIAAQLSAVRRRSLQALGRELDDLEHRVDEFVAHWRPRERKRNPRLDLPEALHDAVPAGDAPLTAGHRDREEIPVALAWFAAGEYERAIERWPDLAQDWAHVPHGEYSRRMDGHIKWMCSHGVHVRAVAPILVGQYTAWCEERGEEPEDARARAAYAADRFAARDAFPWPPSRNAPCWCGSQRKYKKCCGAAAARPMHDTGA
ncbi:MAG: SEC-C metal-binding domain-containing protein, partial [Solirubrobacteraceae bacterium]